MFKHLHSPLEHPFGSLQRPHKWMLDVLGHMNGSHWRPESPAGANYGSIAGSKGGGGCATRGKRRPRSDPTPVHPPSFSAGLAAVVHSFCRLQIVVLAVHKFDTTEARQLVSEQQDLAPVAALAVGAATSSARSAAPTSPLPDRYHQCPQKMPSWNDKKTSNKSWLGDVSPSSHPPLPCTDYVLLGLGFQKACQFRKP
jgi:hypothetical protein